MENASKALIMAGGVLIAMLIIALLVRGLGSVAVFQMAQLTEEEQKQLMEFNQKYTKYLNEYVYGNEVLTLINKYEYESSDGSPVKEYAVKVEIDGETPTRNENNYTYNAETNSYGNETRYYKCTKIEYNNSTGRVNKIYFKQITLSAEAES